MIMKFLSKLIMKDKGLLIYEKKTGEFFNSPA